MGAPFVRQQDLLKAIADRMTKARRGQGHAHPALWPTLDVPNTASLSRRWPMPGLDEYKSQKYSDLGIARLSLFAALA
jgi:hypothetical protein